MRHYLCLLFLGFCAAPQGLALEQAPPAPEPNDLSDKLELFVNEAINEGLLTPSATGEPAPPEHQTEDTETAGHSPAIPPVQAASPACDLPYYLDFQEFKHLNQYQEIYSLREGSNQPASAGDPYADWKLTRAYIALGLNSEALMTLNRATGPQPLAYRKLTLLMENTQQPDITYFRQLTDCHQQAGIWLALALLVDNQDEGVQVLENQLMAFPHLPLQLRINFATIAVPALDTLDQRLLAQKLMTSFTGEEISNSSRLQFNQAFMQLEAGDEAAQKAVRTFLTQPQFQEAALSVLLRNQQSLDVAYKDILLDELVQKIGQAENDRQVAASLRYALQELSAGSRYQPILQLADLPALQGQSAQDDIKHHLIAALQRDLSGDDPLRNLMALDALITESNLLDDQPERGSLYDQATVLAFRFGFGSLGEELSKKAETGEAAAQQRAGLAFRRHDYPTVYSFARNHPRNQRINLLAGLSAISQRDVSRLELFEGRLTLEPETILALIEQDATSAQWMVSEDVYLAAEKLTDTEQRQRVERVLTLKQAAREGVTPAPNLTMARLAETLSRTGHSLETMTGGAR